MRNPNSNQEQEDTANVWRHKGHELLFFNHRPMQWSWYIWEQPTQQASDPTENSSKQMAQEQDCDSSIFTLFKFVFACLLSSRRRLGNSWRWSIKPGIRSSIWSATVSESLSQGRATRFTHSVRFKFDISTTETKRVKFFFPLSLSNDSIEREFCVCL